MTNPWLNKTDQQQPPKIQVKNAWKYIKNAWPTKKQWVNITNQQQPKSK